MVEKTRIGGVHMHVRSVANELRRLGFDVDIITRVEDLGQPHFIQSYQYMKKFFSKLAQEYDVVHAHDWSIAYPAVRAGINNLIATFHGFPRHLFAEFFQNAAVSMLGNRAVVVSPKMLLKYACATYIPNGVDVNIFKRINTAKIFSRFSPCYLGIAQKYSRDQVFRIARELCFQTIVAEKIPYDQMPKFYSSLDVFVSVPPSTAGFNLVWLEAMACEVPYIVGTDAGVGEILPIYKVSNFNNLRTILAAIREGILPPLKGSRQWILENDFTWKHHARKLIKLYDATV